MFKPVFKRFPTLRIPIWLQLTTANILVVVLTTLLLNAVILNRQADQLYSQSVKIGSVSLNYFVSNARIPLIENDVVTLNMLIHQADAVEGILYAVIVNHEGSIAAHSDHREIGRPYEPISPESAPQQEGTSTYFPYHLASGEHILNLSRPITFQDKQLGEAHVGVSLDFIQHRVRQNRTYLILITVTIIVFATVMAGWLGQRFSQPVLTLEEGTRQIASGNYRYRVTLKRRDEIGSLARAFNRMGEEIWKQSLTRDIFGKYLGPEVVQMILEDPENAKLRERRVEATVIFSDIRGFTAFSEGREPEDVVRALNDYFDIATRIILDHGGYIDKFIGDAVLGVFGVPIIREDHCNRALQAAIALQQAVKEAGAAGKLTLSDIGIGINSGVLVAGNIGSTAKMEYTVIGDTVNVASRISGLARAGEIIITRYSRDCLGSNMAVDVLSPQKIRGRIEPIELFRVRYV